MAKTKYGIRKELALLSIENRRLTAKIIELEHDLEEGSVDMSVINSYTEQYKNDAQMWRVKYELLLNTPEHKASAEEAFTRGEKAALRKVQAGLIQFAQDMAKDLG